MKLGILGGVGLNNIGLLVKIWGKVTDGGADWFAVDDGSGVDDGYDPIGVEVNVPVGVTPPKKGEYVSVTGVSSCVRIGGEVLGILLVRDAGDIHSL